MGDRVVITKSKLDNLANKINEKNSNSTIPMTIDEMLQAITDIQDTGTGSRQWWMDMCAEKKTYTSFFQNTSITEVPPIDFTNVVGLASTFNGCTSLITIPLMNVPNVGSFGSTFVKCESLVHISFVEETIKKTISFFNSPLLDDDSVQSIIDGLAVVTTTQTLTFHSAVSEKLTKEQESTILSKGWTLK